MKPFLLLQSRPEDAASDDEYTSFCMFGGLQASQLVRLRMDQGRLPNINLGDYSGIMLGGGPSNFAYDDARKTDMQKAFEPWLFELLGHIVAADKPFLGACLGMGALVRLQGGTVSFEYPEPIGAVQVRLSEGAQSDPLLADVPVQFEAFVGHKEGVGTAPPGCIVLARSDVCIQMIRTGDNVYATQFHPELNASSLAVRINIYKHAGYFPPEQSAALIAASQQAKVTEPVHILENFIKRYSHIS